MWQIKILITPIFWSFKNHVAFVKLLNTTKHHNLGLFNHAKVENIASSSRNQNGDIFCVILNSFKWIKPNLNEPVHWNELGFQTLQISERKIYDELIHYNENESDFSALHTREKLV